MQYMYNGDQFATSFVHSGVDGNMAIGVVRNERKSDEIRHTSRM
jgi:hypothetical protein